MQNEINMLKNKLLTIKHPGLVGFVIKRFPLSSLSRREKRSYAPSLYNLQQDRIFREWDLCFSQLEWTGLESGNTQVGSKINILIQWLILFVHVEFIF